MLNQQFTDSGWPHKAGMLRIDEKLVITILQHLRPTHHMIELIIMQPCTDTICASHESSHGNESIFL